VPDLDFPVGMHGEKAADPGEAAAVGAEDHLPDVSLGVRPGELFPAGLRVPDLDLNLAARGEAPAVGTELYASAGPGPTQRDPLLTRVHAPDLQFSFLLGFPTACGSQALTVRAEGDTPHPDDRVSVLEAKKGRGDLVLKDLLHVPNLDHPVPAPRGKVSTVGAKLNAGGIQLVSLPFPEFLAGRGPTESDQALLRGRGQVLA